MLGVEADSPRSQKVWRASDFATRRVLAFLKKLSYSSDVFVRDRHLAQRTACHRRGAENAGKHTASNSASPSSCSKAC
jgi:hypothetical protein